MKDELAKVQVDSKAQPLIGRIECHLKDVLSFVPDIRNVRIDALPSGKEPK